MFPVILLSMLMILLSTGACLYTKCDQASDLWQQLELARDTGWCRKWFVDFNAGKSQLVSFERSNKAGATNVKKDGSVHEEKSSFKMLRLSFSSKFDWGSYIIFVAKTVSRKTGALFRSTKFLSLEVALLSL